MSTLTQDDAECLVFAFKEGMLAAAGHDVKLRVTRFEITVGPGGAVEGTFDPDSLRTACAMRRGEDNPGALSDRDKRTIDGYVRDDILQTDQHDEIVFRSDGTRRDGEAWRVDGSLTLHGRTKSVRAKLTREGDQLVTRVRIRQPEFGMKPFRALLGALKIKPVVEVELRVPSSTADQLAE